MLVCSTQQMLSLFFYLNLGLSQALRRLIRGQEREYETLGIVLRYRSRVFAFGKTNPLDLLLLYGRNANQHQVKQEARDATKNCPDDRVLHDYRADPHHRKRDSKDPDLRRQRNAPSLFEGCDVVLVNHGRANPAMAFWRVLCKKKSSKKHERRGREDRDENTNKA